MNVRNTFRVVVAFLLACGTSFAADTPPIHVRHWQRMSSPAAAAAPEFQRRSAAEVAQALHEQLLARASERQAVVLQPKAQSGGRRMIDRSARRAGSGTPLQLHSIAESFYGITALSLGTPDANLDLARQFLRQNAGALHIDDPDEELVLDRQEADELGRRHVRFTQQYRGTPVWPSDLIVHLDARGNVDLVDGAFVATPRRVVRQPIVEWSEAMERAAGALGVDRTACGVPQLIIYTAHGRYPRLAWRVGVSASLLSSWWIVVDAANGAIVDRISRVMTEAVTGSGIDPLGVTRTLHLWRSASRFFMVDTSKQMFNSSSQPPDPNKTRGAIMIFDAQNQPPTPNPQSISTLVLSESDSATSWPVADTVAAAFWLSATYDYYLRTFNRNSIDGSGGNIIGVTRLGRGMENAFWSSSLERMFFGDADLYTSSVDAIGHELTHGVTSKTAGLVYKDQSGALNEAMSDVFGEMIEADVLGSNDWIIGSSLRTPLRSMSDPGRFHDPAKMSDFIQTSQDNGGVHINSGIINRAFFLLTEGLNGGIGRTDASAIFYRALTQHLTKDSQFIDARLAAVTSAKELFGPSSRQAQMTASAFDAVELFDASQPNAPPPIPAVSGADATLFIFFDTKANRFFLGRKEIPSDGDLGAPLSRFDISEERPSVTGDGSLAVFVDSVHDVCLIATDGSQPETCLGLPAKGVRVSSVGMSRDARRFGFVLLKSDNNPDDHIVVVDLKTDQTQTYELTASTKDGPGALNTVLFADTMTFTADGQFIVFDAFNVLTLSDGSRIGVWSIGALALANGATEDLVPPIPGLDIEFPDLGRTSDDLLTFETRDSATGETTVIAANLETEDFSVVGKTSGVLSVPSYTGDDRAIVFAAASTTPTKTSLLVQRLDSDHITPVGGAERWIDDGESSTIYRRGTYAGPSLNPGRIGFASAAYFGQAGATTTTTVNRVGGNQGSVSVSYRTVDGTAAAGRDYTPAFGTLTWADGDKAGKTFQVRMSPNAGAGDLTLRLTDATGGAQIDTQTATLSISPSLAPPPKTRRRRSVRH